MFTLLPITASLAGTARSGSLEADPEIGIFVRWFFRSESREVGQSRGRKLIPDAFGPAAGLSVVAWGPLELDLHH